VAADLDVTFEGVGRHAENNWPILPGQVIIYPVCTTTSEEALPRRAKGNFRPSSAGVSGHETASLLPIWPIFGQVNISPRGSTREEAGHRCGKADGLSWSGAARRVGLQGSWVCPNQATTFSTLSLHSSAGGVGLCSTRTFFWVAWHCVGSEIEPSVEIV